MDLNIKTLTSMLDLFRALCEARNNISDDDYETQEIINGKITDLYNAIGAFGKDFDFMFDRYNKMMTYDNKYIDIDDSYLYQDEEKLIAVLKEYGIEKFTFSSTYSQAIESSWNFLKQGCILEGMIEINNKYGEKIPAYIFKVGDAENV